jgi:Cu(I)/Ag(I) efflux system membrane fusion protein/cobalt-zinc-cadmium efflux system membrane fusion protein
MNDKKGRSTKFYFAGACIFTAFAAALVTYAGIRLFGYHPAHESVTIERINAEDGAAIEKKLWTCGMHPWIITEEPGQCPICGMDLVPKRDEKGKGGDKAGEKKGERKILYWRAPMNPSEIYEEPGKSAMGMDLVPVYEDEVQGGVKITIDPVIEQNMGVRTSAARMEPLVNTIRTYGHITYDETQTTEVSSKVSGWLEKLYVNFTGEHVEKGDPLFEIYSPELTAAQEEYLIALRGGSRLREGGEDSLLASARRRLLYFDVAESEIDEMKRTRIVKKTVLIRSPFTGVVTMKNAIEGVYVKAGQTLYRIADLSTVWVEAHIYEYELDWVREGLYAEMTLPYLPGKTYSGKVSFIYPYLQRQTRDVVIRLEFENPELELKPDMYADVRIKTVGDGKGLAIPSEAVIRSGERNVVFVAEGEGRYSPRETSLGMTLDGGKIQILSGLGPGEKVVTSGQFLLDSESKLKEAVAKMMEPKNEEGVDKTEHDHADGGKPEESVEDDFFGDMQSPVKPITPEDGDFFKDLE